MAGNKEEGAHHLDTRLVHDRCGPDPSTGAVAPPIHLSTTFARDADGELIGPHLYGRYGNPNRDGLERCLADLEGGSEAACFASGSAAAHAVFSTLESGERLVIGEDTYFGLRRLFADLGHRFGVEVVAADLRDPDADLSGAALVLCESPTNPRMHVVDLEALAARAHAEGAALVVDNTLATPLLQRPIDVGADWVLHSTTKFLAGHGDLLGGAVIAAHAGERWAALRDLQRLAGAVPSPFDAWLLRRSIATLGVRLARQVDSAERLARFFDHRSEVVRVHYPGLESHPDHAVAARQMARPGAVMSLSIGGGFEGARRFAGALSLAVRATSLGAVHTLVEHRAVVEGPGTPTPPDLVRIAVGIEAYEDLEADFAQALEAAAPAISRR